MEICHCQLLREEWAVKTDKMAQECFNIHVIYRFFLSCKNLKFSVDFLYLYFFSYFCSKHRLRVHVRPRRGGSNECPQSMFWSKNKINRYTSSLYPSFSAYAKTKAQITTAQLISAFIFATWILQSLFFLNPKSQVSSLLL